MACLWPVARGPWPVARGPWPVACVVLRSGASIAHGLRLFLTLFSFCSHPRSAAAVRLAPGHVFRRRVALTLERFDAACGL